jgi:TRAP transporter 4TM/12TM fusion protein
MEQTTMDVTEIQSNNTKERKLGLTICSLIAIAFSIFQVWANSFSYLPTININAIHLAFLLLLGFQLYPVKRGTTRSKVPAYDWILGIIGAACALYFCFTFDALYARGMLPYNYEYIIAGIGIVVTLEAGRRSTGPILPVLAIVFLLYARFGQYMPGVFAHGGFTWERISSRMFMTDAGVFGTTLTISSTYLFLFILFGVFLSETGVGEFFNDFSMALVGHVRGGPAQVATISSAMMGTISGSSIANVATTGTFTIPLMKRTGYEAHFAGAVEAVASTGGMIMPPIMGAAAFLMAGFLGVPYNTIMIAGIVPALLYYLSAAFVIDMEAQRLDLGGLPREELPDLKHVLKTKGFLVLPVLILIAVLIMGMTPIRAAFTGIISTIVIGVLNPRKRMGIKEILNCLEQAARNAVPIGLACAVVSFIVGVTGMTALGSVVAYNMLKLSGGNLIIALLLVLVASIISSMGLPATACYVVVATIAAPALLRMNVPAIAAHFFVFWFGCLSGITPPVALASYTAAGISGSNPNDVAITGIRIAAPGFLIPFLLVYRPELLGIGGSLTTFFTSCLAGGVACLSTAMATHGYLWGRLSVLERIIAAVASLALVRPDVWSYVGMTAIAAIVISRWLRARRIKLASA